MNRPGEFNKTLSPGDAAPAWKDLPGTDGQKHSLADLKKFDVVVVVFTCNSCPIAIDYEPRILAFHQKHCGPEAKVTLVAINVNTIKEDNLPEMIKRAAKKKYGFAYLYDESQEIAKKFGATSTPEFFVLNKDRQVTYLGAMDDAGPPNEATVNYLEEAVKATLAGEKPKVAETLPRGCKIRWNRPR
jgi:peroxiredoxin